MKIDSIGEVARISCASNRLGGSDTLGVGVTAANQHVHSRLLGPWICVWIRTALDLQHHSPACVLIQAPGANPVAIGCDLKPVVGIAVITVDADVTISGIGCTRHGLGGHDAFVVCVAGGDHHAHCRLRRCGRGRGRCGGRRHGIRQA